MAAIGRKATDLVRATFSFILIAVFSLWVSDAQALSSGGGNSGGSSGGGGNSGGSSGGSNGGGGNNGGAGDRGGREDGFFNGNYDEIVTRAQTSEAPVGFVISDDVCTGGKYEKC